MFKNEKDDNITTPKHAETIIGPSVKVKGNFHGEGNMIIEGEVEGSIITKNNLMVGEKAHIKASIEANDAKVAGTINGNLNIKGYLEIQASAKINGDINSNSFSVEKGAKINGNLNMGGISQKDVSDKDLK